MTKRKQRENDLELLFSLLAKHIGFIKSPFDDVDDIGICIRHEGIIQTIYLEQKTRDVEMSCEPQFGQKFIAKVKNKDTEDLELFMKVFERLNKDEYK